jgi:hypothetical protein
MPDTASYPLAHAYAHRDCEFDPPLWRSLQNGFTHIEVDVYCLFGRILVGHDLSQLRPGRTLKMLYLDPLYQHLQRHQSGIFADNTPLWLFIDVKSEAGPSYKALHKLLESYQDMITTFTPFGVQQRALTVIVSGNRPSYEVTERMPLRYAALDGRLPDVGVHTNPYVMPIISDNWRKHFGWLGHGSMPANEQKRLEALLSVTHRHGQKLRFWNTPDTNTPQRKAIWNKLMALGVDLINTDDVEGLKEYSVFQSN